MYNVATDALLLAAGVGRGGRSAAKVAVLCSCHQRVGVVVVV